MTERKKLQTDKSMHWKRISRKTVFKNTRMVLIEDEVELPSGERVDYLLYGLDTSSVTVICFRDNQVLLQQEYSYPPDEVIYQFPGGKVEGTESLVSAAKRELIEESKLNPENVCELGWYYVNNRRSNAKMYVMMAEGFKKSNTLCGDLEEDIVSRWVPIVKFEQMINRGLIVNYSVLAAWAIYKGKLPQC